MTSECSLCQSIADFFFLENKRNYSYFRCKNCDLIFLEKKFHLSSIEEKNRYLLHNNDANDLDYQKFLKPLFESIKTEVAISSKGLDFGCGNSSALSKLLVDYGFHVSLYDPYFFPDTTVLKSQTYEFIVASEVFEHLQCPRRTTLMLRELLKPNVILGVMTLLFHDKIDFEKWFYRNDPTHISFYSKKTFEWIRDSFNFSALEIKSDRLIILKT